MKKLVINIILGAFLIVAATSCLNFKDEPHVPTYQEEQMQLARYLETIEADGYDIDTTDLGIFYVTLEEGEGEFPQPGDSLVVGYAGYYVDGELFDASDLHEEDGTYNFVLGNPAMISGWDSGMEVINKNARVQLIIPSEFAYGSDGSGTIPPYTTLVFVVKMIDIIHL